MSDLSYRTGLRNNNCGLRNFQQNKRIHIKQNHSRKQVSFEHKSGRRLHARMHRENGTGLHLSSHFSLTVSGLC